MRRAAKVDQSQAAIVKALRAIGCSVHYIKEPVDLAVGLRGRTVLLECKKKTNWRLTPQQERFFATFNGEAYIVEDEGQALRAMLQEKK